MNSFYVMFTTVTLLHCYDVTQSLVWATNNYVAVLDVPFFYCHLFLTIITQLSFFVCIFALKAFSSTCIKFVNQWWDNLSKGDNSCLSSWHGTCVSCMRLREGELEKPMLLLCISCGIPQFSFYDELIKYVVSICLLSFIIVIIIVVVDVLSFWGLRSSATIVIRFQRSFWRRLRQQLKQPWKKWMQIRKLFLKLVLKIMFTVFKTYIGKIVWWD